MLRISETVWFESFARSQIKVCPLLNIMSARPLMFRKRNEVCGVDDPHVNKKSVPLRMNPLKLYVWGWLLTLTLLQLGTGVVFAQKQPAAAESRKALAEGNTSGYAGTEACAHCHQVLSEQLSKTVHASAKVAGTSISTSCEACHGPGKAHADAEMEAEKNDTKDPEAKKLIFRFDSKNASAMMVNERCL